MSVFRNEKRSEFHSESFRGRENSSEFRSKPCSEREMREMLRICYEPFMEEKNERNSVPNPSWNASNSRDAGNILMQATAGTSTTAAGMPTGSEGTLATAGATATAGTVATETTGTSEIARTPAATGTQEIVETPITAGTPTTAGKPTIAGTPGSAKTPAPVECPLLIKFLKKATLEAS